MAKTRTISNDKIISIASKVFVEKGYKNTSINDLTQFTGINRKRIYDDFINKNGLFLEVLKRYEERSDAIIGLLRQMPQGIDNFAAFFKEISQFIGADGCLIAICINDINYMDDETKAALMQAVNLRQQLFKDNLLAMGIADHTADTASDFVICSYFGMCTYMRIEPNAAKLHDITGALLSSLESYQ